MATVEGRIVPTLEQLTAQHGSRVDGTVQRARYFERLRPPRIGEGPPVEQMATLEPGPGVDSDDLLDRAPDVRVLFAGDAFGSFNAPPLELRRPHENVEGLIATRRMTAETLAMFPNLRFVQLCAQQVTPEFQAGFPPSLEEIWADGLDLAALSRLTKLKYLRTRLRSGRAAQSQALAALSELRGLDLEVHGSLRGTSAFGRLENLEAFSVNAVSNLDFRALSRCRRLSSLSVGGMGSTKTLDGIEKLEALKGLALGGRRCPPISPIARLPTLEHLSISSLQAPPDLDVVGTMTGLRSLSLYIGSVSSVYTLKSATLFSDLERLEGLQCIALLEDQDLTPLARLKRLKYLCFLGTFREEAVRRLQTELPDCKVDLTVGTPAPARPELKVGPLAATEETDGTWSVFQDLRVILDVGSNHAAEAAVQRELKRRSPAVLARIVFDSENDTFAAYLETRQDLEQLAAAVEALANRHPPSA